MALLLILVWLFGFVLLGVGSGLTGSSSQGSGHAGPPPKCSKQTGADTQEKTCRGANP